MASFVVAAVVSSLLVLQLAASLMATSHAAVPAEVYWSSVLPRTPMPNAIKDLLPSSHAVVGVDDEKMAEPAGTHVVVGKGGVVVDANKPGKGSTNVDIGHGGVGVDVVGMGHGAANTHVVVGKGGVIVAGGKGGAKPVIVGVGPAAGANNPFNYLYAATETQLHDDPTVAFFFLEKDLRRGSQMRLHFPASSSNNGGKLVVSRKEADSIPFASGELPECEAAVAKGETRLCATSLESIVDFATSSLGTHDVAVVSTTVAGAPAAPEQRYTIASVKTNKASETEVVACHARPYAPHVVFYCHATKASRVYKVELVGEDDGTAVAAAVVCHSDTAAWNPRHLAFQVLKVKPGGVPVCHFLPQDHVVWTRKVNALYP